MRYSSVVGVLAVAAACASSGSPDRVKEGERTVGSSEEITRMIGTGSYIDIRAEADHRVSSHPVGSSADSAWAVLPTVYADLGIPVGVFLTDSREVGVLNHRTRRRLGELGLARILDCGKSMGIENADSYNVTLTVITRVVPHASGTSVLLTQLEGSATPSGVSSAPVRCTTTGHLENEIARLVRERATAG